MQIIIKGKLSVWAKDMFGNSFEVHQLLTGDSVGYSDLLKVIVSDL